MLGGVDHAEAVGTDYGLAVRAAAAFVDMVHVPDASGPGAASTRAVVSVQDGR